MNIFLTTLLLILIINSSNYSLDFWEAEAGLDTVTILSLAVNSGGFIFAGTSMDGVLRSSNGGVSWTNMGIMNFEIRSLAVSSSGDILVNTDPWGGVYRSSDNGNSWDSLGFAHFNKSIAINNLNGFIFVGTGALGIARTTNNGVNWEYSNNGMTANFVTSLIIQTTGEIYAGTLANSSTPGSGGVYRSSNNGGNWVQIKTGLSSLDIFSLAIDSNGVLFAGTSGGGVFRSIDDGANWVQINQGLTGDGLYVYSMAINANDDIFAGTAIGVFRSTDDGANWVQINSGLTNTFVHSLAINSSGIVFAGTDGGIFQSLESSLPVELVSFSATYENNQIDLKWRTATEVSNFGFKVERTNDIFSKTDWENIGFVQGHGNSNSPKNYSFVDKDFYGGNKFIYRLKQIDTDGNFEYSNEIEADVNPNNFELYQNYPNPFNPSTKIKYALSSNAKGETFKVVLKVYNVVGNEVATLVDENQEPGVYEIEFSMKDLASGIYFYQIKVADFSSMKKMVLMK